MTDLIELSTLLSQLQRAARQPRSAAEAAGMAKLAEVPVADLRRLDEFSRRWRPDPEPQNLSFLGRSRLSDWLASMVRDGRLRERAVRRLAADPAPAASRLLALRVADPVPRVRDAAWQALTRRTDAQRAAAIAPVLVTLRGRLRASEALDHYAAVYASAHRTPLWRLLIDHPDRQTRRWAIRAGIAGDGFGVTEARQRLAREPDQLMAHRWISLLVCDPVHASELLGSRWAAAREAALDAIGPDLDTPSLEGYLLDRAARVRTAAQRLAPARGIDTGQFYLRHWTTTRDPRSLRSAAHLGAGPSQDEWLVMLGDADARVRATAASLIDVEAEAITPLFDLLTDESAVVAAAATRALASSQTWRYEQAADRWEAADQATRRRLGRLMRSRSGWDQVRGGLLAMTDDDPFVHSDGLVGLQQWLATRATRMFTGPSTAQLADLQRLLGAARGLPLPLRNEIEFRLRLPLTPPPWRTAEELERLAD